MRFLFVVIPQRGHLYPYLGPALHLRERGHEVEFYAEGPIDEPLGALGLRRWPPAYPPTESLHAGAAFSARVRDEAWLRGFVERMLLGGVLDQATRLERTIAQLRPDALVLDPMVYAGAIAAHRAGVPWAAVSNSLNPALPDDVDSALLRTVAKLAPRRDALFAAQGLRPRFRGCDLLAPELTIAFTSRALVGESPPGVHLVGASLPPRPREPPSGVEWSQPRRRPRAYMSLGSQVYHQPRIFKTVAAALRDRELELVASLGDLDPTAIEPWPRGARLRPWWPQLEVLPHVDVMVTHGGANSVMEALAHGVPLLVSPICNDQFHQATLVARAGLGLSLDLQTATPDACGAALDALLEPDLRARAAGSMPSDGASRAADLLESWLPPRT